MLLLYLGAFFAALSDPSGWHSKKPGYRSNSSGPLGLPVFSLYPLRVQLFYGT
jgi:hypothetical protein